MKFFYQLKTPIKDNYYTDWKVAWFDIIEAENKKAAKKLIEEEHGGIIAEKATKTNEGKLDYKIFIVELDTNYEKLWLTVRTCDVCKQDYTFLRQRQLDPMASPEYCSRACSFQVKTIKVSSQPIDAAGIHKPVIYRILNKLTGKSYVGQTTQAFTLRWYQHFFNPSDVKFHNAIKDSKLSDWTFEVVEQFESRIVKSDLDAREHYWIEKFDSIKNGYNTAIAAGSKKMETQNE